MAIDYKKIGWNTTKFVNPSNMNQMDNGIKAACDGVDAANENLADVQLTIGDNNGFVQNFTSEENANNAPIGKRKAMNSEGQPSFMGEWVLYDTYYYDDDKSFGWQIAYDMNAPQIGYRYKRNGSWTDWESIVLNSDLAKKFNLAPESANPDNVVVVSGSGNNYISNGVIHVSQAFKVQNGGRGGQGALFRFTDYAPVTSTYLTIQKIGDTSFIDVGYVDPSQHNFIITYNGLPDGDYVVTGEIIVSL